MSINTMHYYNLLYITMQIYQDWLIKRKKAKASCLILQTCCITILLRVGPVGCKQGPVLQRHHCPVPSAGQVNRFADADGEYEPSNTQNKKQSQYITVQFPSASNDLAPQRRLQPTWDTNIWRHIIKAYCRFVKAKTAKQISAKEDMQQDAWSYFNFYPWSSSMSH